MSWFKRRKSNGQAVPKPRSANLDRGPGAFVCKCCQCRRQRLTGRDMGPR